MPTNKHKPNKILTNEELEQKIIKKYGTIESQPTTLKDKVVKELNKLK